MKKIINSNIKTIMAVIITALICISGTIYAATLISSKDVTYSSRTVEDALNELYIKANARDIGAQKICKFIDNTYGAYGEVGSKYECEVGNNIKYNFYLLSKNNDNTVDLIMEQNISDTVGTMKVLTWYEAMKYFMKDNSGYNTKQSWVNVMNIDLPKAQAIAEASGRTNYIASDDDQWFCFNSYEQDYANGICADSNVQKYNWLYDYTYDCNGCSHVLDSNYATGYWTRDVIAGTGNAWAVEKYGTLASVDVFSTYGVRPVITVLKSNLYS